MYKKKVERRLGRKEGGDMRVYRRKRAGEKEVEMKNRKLFTEL